jgi:hypothetical protein
VLPVSLILRHVSKQTTAKLKGLMGEIVRMVRNGLVGLR